MRKNNGEFEPKLYFLILYPGQQTPVYFPIPCAKFMENDWGKDRMSIYIQACWYKKKLTSPPGISLLAVCLISDAWITMRPMKPGQTPEDVEKAIYTEDPNWRVSKDSKRREVLILSVCYTNESKIHYVPYKRKGRNIEFEAELDQVGIENASGRLTRLYPEDITGHGVDHPLFKYLFGS